MVQFKPISLSAGASKIKSLFTGRKRQTMPQKVELELEDFSASRQSSGEIKADVPLEPLSSGAAAKELAPAPHELDAKSLVA
jgi:hypothetical protein